MIVCIHVLHIIVPGLYLFLLTQFVFDRTIYHVAQGMPQCTGSDDKSSLHVGVYVAIGIHTHLDLRRLSMSKLINSYFDQVALFACHSIL